MWLINLILNVAGLLLWLRWREKNPREIASRSQILLAATLKRTRPEYPRILFLGGLLLLLALRSVFYWQLGDPLGWVPSVKFGFLPLFFRSTFFWRIFAFSFCSFGEMLAIFYLTLLLFSIVNDSRSTANALQKQVATHLGWIDRLPQIVKILLPLIGTIIVWAALSSAFVLAHLLPARKSFTHLVGQGAILGISVYLVWEYVLVILFTGYFLNTYIYFGTWPIWDFIDQTGKRLLKPIINLRIGKVTLAPIIGIAVVLLIGFGLRWVLPQLYLYTTKR